MHSSAHSAKDKQVLLVISGGIAAYKSLELIRLLRKGGVAVRAILTRGGAEFITPLSVASLCGQPCYTDLFSLKDEAEMGHIRLSREADLIVVAPASADLIAKMAHGLCDDLATAALLASDKDILIAPAMNVRMWEHKATQSNIQTLAARGIQMVGPVDGEMACGEYGAGRMAEPDAIADSIFAALYNAKPLAGKKALVTSGPTYEPIDPVRFIGNRSSGKQGHEIASALAALGADVTLVTGPVALPDPARVHTVHIESAAQMLEACKKSLPVDIAVCAAAVGDFAVDQVAGHKIKKQKDAPPPTINLRENPDILATLSRMADKRPALVVGFAAETQNLVEEASRKRIAKGCDWIIANHVGGGAVFGADDNLVTLITAQGVNQWPEMSKRDVAKILAQAIANYFDQSGQTSQAAE